MKDTQKKFLETNRKDVFEEISEVMLYEKFKKFVKESLEIFFLKILNMYPLNKCRKRNPKGFSAKHSG